MILEIDLHSGVPIYRQIVDQVRGQVVSGELGEGEQLMSVRELAGQLKVNPMTVSKAYARLELEGLVDRQRGVGLFVARIREKEKDRVKAEILSEILEKAAVTAVQLDIDIEDVLAKLTGFYQGYNGKKG